MITGKPKKVNYYRVSKSEDNLKNFAQGSQESAFNAKGKVLQTVSHTACLEKKLQLKIEKPALFKMF